MINKNDFVMIDFVGRIASSGAIFDLTEKDVADKEGIHGDFNFNPILVIPQSDYVIKPISESLVNRNPGEKYTINVKAKDAFGEFNSKLVKTYGLNSFVDNNINPHTGDLVMLDDKLATILSVSGGRVMVSFNHPLAGKDLVYEIKVLSVLEDNKDKCSAIFQHYVGNKPESISLENNSVDIVYKGEIKPYLVTAIEEDIKKYINKDFSVKIHS